MQVYKYELSYRPLVMAGRAFQQPSLPTAKKQEPRNGVPVSDWLLRVMPLFAVS